MKKLALLAIALGLTATACGGSSHDMGNMNANAGRSLTITMTDNAFEPATIDVAKGETISFTFVNKGKVDHEAFIGDSAAQQAHEMNMTSANGMDHGSDAVMTMKPGTSGIMSHTFDAAGTVLIGCHEPGHYQAGMKLTVNVP
jgi:uncharacterized cupredoxin-like copper-binding protein